MGGIIYTHTHIYTHTELKKKNKIPQQQADIFYQNFLREKCAQITRFQELSACVVTPLYPSISNLIYNPISLSPHASAASGPRAAIQSALSTFHKFQKHLHARAQPAQTTACISDTFSYSVLTKPHRVRVGDQYVHFSNTVSCYSMFGSPRGLRHLEMQDNS